MKRVLAFAAVLVLASLPGYGQTSAPEAISASSPSQQVLQKSFKLAFVVREIDDKGKVLNSREYDALIAALPHRSNPNASIRTGVRVPVSVGGAQFTYIDVGANFDVNTFQVMSEERVALSVQIDLSSIDSTDKQTSNYHPAIHQNKWHGDEQMTLGQRKVIFSSDDLTSKNKVQVELTVTEVK